MSAAMRHSRIALSIWPGDLDECRALIGRAGPHVGLVEVRLDAMERPDPEAVVRGSPIRVIATCRPRREGGRFDGSERERLGLLAAAANAGAAYVDLEWDAAAPPARRSARHRTIVSRHFLQAMPDSLLPAYHQLRARGDVVKLAAPASRLADLRAVFQLFTEASTPVIGIGMGEAGRLTRLLGLTFEHVLLTYGSLDATRATAPGQLTVAEMVERYALHRAGPHTRVHVHLCASQAQVRVVETREPRDGHRRLHLGVVVSATEVAETMHLLTACSSDRWTIHVDQELLAPRLPALTARSSGQASWREESTP
jgi:3-dehydroquinate dehydratase/shikimate dehydrogenase